MSTITESGEVVFLGLDGGVLRVVEGPDLGKELVLSGGEVIVGSGDDADLELTDPKVSRRHMRVELTPDGFAVTDLESRNGTFYLGTRLERAVLPPGAAVRLGSSRLAFASQQPASGQDYSARDHYGAIRGSTPVMRHLYAVLERLEQFPAYTVLIQGESGVGKDLVAREIHANSGRAAGPFEVCDCTALTPNLAESELFGHVKGAFTGAESNYNGVFTRADDGTIFLDEIGELPLDLQPKLLRVLERKELRPVGSTRTHSVDVRVIAATNRDLAAEVREKRFREDLYFRLKMVPVDIPPLRERREDIPELIRTFIEELSTEPIELSPDTMALFTTGYDWPGNVRELHHAVASTLALGAVPSTIEQGAIESAAGGIDIDVDSKFQDAKRRLVDAFEREYLETQLERNDGNISAAARASGVERNYFKQLLRKHDLLTSK